MVRGFNAGAAYVLVRPNLRGWDGDVRTGVTANADAHGREAGSRIGTAMSKGIKRALMTVGATAAIVGGVALKSGLDRLLDIEDAQAKMRALGYEGEQIESIMDSALTSVKGTAFGLGEAASVAAKALNAGVQPGQQLTDHLTGIAGAAALAGVSMDEMGDVINQVTAGGKVSNDILNQMTTRNIPMLQWLAKEYGVTQGELQKMVTEGKVDAATFNRVLQENIGDAAVIASDTTRGAFMNMRASLGRVGANLLEGVFPVFKRTFLGVTDLLGPVEAGAKVAGAALGAFLERAISAGVGIYNVLFKGDFTGGIFGVSEDSRLVDFLFRVRDTAISTWNQASAGVTAFRDAWSDADSEITSSGFPGIMQRLGFWGQHLWGELTGGITAFRAAWQYADGEVTSSGFPGVMERIAGWMVGIRDTAKQLNFSSWTGFTSSLGTAFSSPTMTANLDSVKDSLVTLKPAAEAFRAELPGIGGAVAKIAAAGLQVLTNVLGFLADNVDTLIKWAPALAAGYVTWRVASLALANSQRRLQMAQVLMTPVVTTNHLLRIKAVRAEVRLTAAQNANTASTNANTTATRAAVVANGQHVASTNTMAKGTGRATLAVKAKTVAMRALNLVLGNNPIGWLVRGLMLLGGVLIAAYHSSEEFRAVVDGAWTSIKTVAGAVVSWFVNTALPAMGSFFAWVGNAAAAFWTNQLQPVFKWIGDTSARVIGWFLTTGWPWMQTAFTAIGTVVSALWTTYVSPALSSVWGFAQTVFGWILNTGWPWLRTAFSAIGTTVSALWTTYVSPALTNVWGLAQTVFSWILNTGWPWLSSAFQQAGEKASWLWNTIISPTFTAIKGGVEAAFSWILNTGWPLVRDAFNNVSEKATWLKDTIFDPVFGGLQTIVSTSWTAISGVFDTFKSGIGSVGDKFSEVKDAIGAAWGWLANLVAKPIIAVIEFVNESFLARAETYLNKIPGVNLTLPRIPVPRAPAATSTNMQSKGGRRASNGMTMLAAGGDVLGRFIHKTADNVLAWLTPKEFVTKVDSAESMRRNFPGWLEHINATGRPPGYAEGGQVAPGRGPSRGTGGFLGDVWNAAWSGAEFLVDLVKDPIGKIKELITGALQGIGQSWPAQAMIGIGKEMVSGIADWVKTKIGIGPDAETGAMSPGMHSAAGLQWPLTWAMIKGVAPESRMTSNFRPGAITASGFKSYHGLGRAVDLVSGNMLATFLKIRNLLPWRELYFSPAGALQMRNGAPHVPTGITRAMHFDHIHAAYALGGRVRNALAGAGASLLPQMRQQWLPEIPDTAEQLLWDIDGRGGYLPQGDSFARNQTGRPEPLMRTDMINVPTADENAQALARVLDGLQVDANNRGLFLAVRKANAQYGRKVVRV